MRTERKGHPAVLARNDLLYIAEAWPDLIDRLGRETSTAADGMPKPVSRTPGLVINEHVSAVIADATKFTWQLADALVQSTDWTPPSEQAPAVLADIARTRVGHFTAHPDTDVRAEFHKRLDDMRRTVEHAAYPDGFRTRTTAVRCEEQGDSPEGERIPCPGFYTFRARGDGSHPDLICNQNRQHRVPPSVWSRSGWRKDHEDAGIGGAA